MREMRIFHRSDDKSATCTVKRLVDGCLAEEDLYHVLDVKLKVSDFLAYGISRSIRTGTRRHTIYVFARVRPGKVARMRETPSFDDHWIAQAIILYPSGGYVTETRRW
jgi:hypothetical protein